MCGLDERIPEGFTYPWRLRIFLAVIRLLLTVGWLLERVRVLSLVDVTNAVLRILSHVKFGKRKTRARDTTFDGVKVRVYAPKTTAGGSYPSLVFFHGGGWAIGNTRMYDDFLLPISNRLQLVIVSVDYRLAPRHKYPAPLDDCLKATKYFIRNAASVFGVDPERVAVGGDSAGGNLAAAVTIRLRDERFQPMPKLQVLVYPVLQSLDFSLPSMIQNGDGPLLTTFWLGYYTSLYASGSTKYASAMTRNRHVDRGIRQRVYDAYLNHGWLDEQYRAAPYEKPDLRGGDEKVWRELEAVLLDPYFSPLLCDDLSGLPETFIYSAWHDVLRDEGLLYARRLREAGVPVTHVVDQRTLHGICSFRHFFPKETYDALNTIANFLRAKL